MMAKIILAATCAATLAVQARVKFVALGWDTNGVEPDTVLASAESFEKTGLDGIAFRLPVRKQSDGTMADYWHLPYDGPWKYETFADQVPVLKKITSFPGLRHSFLTCSFTPMKARIPWTDDAAWAKFATNFGVLARLAKDGGITGLLLDNEDYTNRLQYKHRPEEGDYKTAFRLARQRGREVFGAAFREYPNVVLMPLWLMSQVYAYAKCENPVKAMTADGSLWPAFVNGLFDVIPPTAKVVDGNEYAYSYRHGSGRYAESATDQLVRFLPLIAPENRVKYRSQLCVGFGLYLDGYTTTNTASCWYMPPVNSSRLEMFRLNLEEAASCADEYIWLYGEQFAFVKWNGKEKRTPDRRHSGGNSLSVTWDDKLPGFARVLRDVKNPGAGVTERVIALRAKGAAVNRFPEALAKESHWQNPRCKQGTYAIDPKAGVGGTITLKGIVNGCAELPVAVTGGDTWVVDLVMSGFAGERCCPSVCYRDAKKKWHWELGTVSVRLGETDNVGRRRACAVIHIPAGMTEMVLMLNGAQKNGETATFTDIFIAKCEE